ncbi:uncharacterized protein Fot_33207 [Forsythia ovata]|uniref:Uncharacterized protein n=1 Tax=Forsythia ovata TaxID=205694 RepID=A0ABD1TA36_9LAMI
MRAEHIELLQSPWLMELGALYINFNVSNGGKQVIGGPFSCDLSATEPIMTLTLPDSVNRFKKISAMSAAEVAEIVVHGRNNKETVIINEGEDALLRGSEQYDVPDSRQTPLAMPHCWQNQEDSAIEQCFWKPLTAAGSNEDNEIEDKQEHQHMNSRNHSKYFQEPQMNCLERESRLYGELEAIYKRIDTAGSNQTGSGSVHLPLNTHIPASEASIGEESMKMAKKRRKRKKMKDQLDSMANLLESLVKQIMEHQENLHQKFTETAATTISTLPQSEKYIV